MKFFKKKHKDRDEIEIDDEEERPVESMARATDKLGEAIDEIEWLIWNGNIPRRGRYGGRN